MLISRDWSGKTLADHKADAKAWVKALLGASVDHEHADPTATSIAVEQGEANPVAWELARPDDPDVAPLQHRLLRALAQRVQWRTALLAAKDRAAQGTADRPAQGTADVSATEVPSMSVAVKENRRDVP